MDSRSLDTLTTLHPKLWATAITAWNSAQMEMPPNVQIIAIEGLRSFQRSDDLYAIGRTVKGEGVSDALPMGRTVTKAKAGQSYHNYGLAFDMTMITNGKDDYTVGPNWMKVVEIMTRYGFTWGGNFPDGQHDNPHFEKTFGYNWRDLLKLHQDGKFIPGTTYVQI